MAKKPTSRAAAKTAVKKKWAGTRHVGEILRTQDDQVQGTRDAAEGQVQSQIQSPAEAEHRHQPSPRRGF